MNESEKKQFIDIIESMKELRLRKSEDYGNSWKIYGLEGLVWQIKSKFIRMINLLEKKVIAMNEPLRDTFMDMANYCIMAVQLIDSDQTGDKMKEMLQTREYGELHHRVISLRKDENSSKLSASNFSREDSYSNVPNSEISR